MSLFVFPLLSFCFAYLVFFFVAEQPDPFRHPSAAVKRRHWRLGRSLGLCVLVGGLAAWLAGRWIPLTLAGLTLAEFVVAAIVALPVLLKYRRKSDTWQSSTDARLQERPSGGNSTERHPVHASAEQPLDVKS